MSSTYASAVGLLSAQGDDSIPSPAVTPRTASHDESWLDVRVFVSSTFVDMREERRILNTEVFPQLEHRFHDRHLNLSVTDLAWGIPSASEAADTVAFCREELACSEIFLYLGAQRFGWVPPPALLRPADAAEWLPGMSITAMEVVEGCLRRGGANALLFLRSPAYAEGLPAGAARDFVSAGEDGEKQAALHAVLRSRYPWAVRDYAPGVPAAAAAAAAAPGAARPPLATWAAFAAEALAELTRMIEAMLPPPREEPLHAPAGVDAAAPLHDMYVYRRSAGAEPRCCVGALAAAVSQPGACAVALAPPGHGASTALACAATAVETAGSAAVFAHFCDAVAEADSELGAFCARLAGALALRNGLRAYAPSSTAAAAAACAHWLACPPTGVAPAGEGGGADAAPPPPPPPRLLIVLDSLDDLCPGGGAAARHAALSWLPAGPLAAQYSVLLSTTSEALAGEAGARVGGARGAPPPLRLPNLSYSERVAVVNARLAVLHKRLDPGVLEAYVSMDGCGSPLWLVTALRCLVRRAIHDNLAATLASFPSDLTALFEREVRAVAAEVGAARLQAFALALLVHRSGFSELEMPQAVGAVERRLAGGDGDAVEAVTGAEWCRLRSKLDFLFAPQGAARGRVRISNAVSEAALLGAAARWGEASPPDARGGGRGLGELQRLARLALADFVGAAPSVPPQRSARVLVGLHAGNGDAERLLEALALPAGLERLFAARDLLAREEFLRFCRAADAGGSYDAAADAFAARALALLPRADGGSAPLPLERLRHALHVALALQLMGALSRSTDALRGVVEATRAAAAAAAAAAGTRGGGAAGRPPAPAAALHAEALLALGSAALAMGDFHGAFRALEEASALHSSRGGALHGPTELARGRCFYSVARYGEALAVVEAVLASACPGLPLGEGGCDAAAARAGHAPALAGIFEALGDTRLALGEPRAALRLFSRAAAFQQAHAGARDASVANLLAKAAQAHRAGGDHARARGLLEDVLRVQEETLGAGHPDLARTRIGLANTLAARGEHLGALQLLRAALAVQLREEGEHSFDAATCLNNIAASLVALRRYGDALAFFSRALAAFGACLGEDHPHTASVLVNLALAYELNGRLIDAIHHMRRAESIHVRVFGAEHGSARELGAAAEALLKKAFIQGRAGKRRVVKRVLAGV
jgi:tetratricopeptide (TPR) repeat protein